MRIGIDKIVEKMISQIENELPERAMRAALELRSASLQVLSGSRSGRVYRIPSGGRYTASSPGEPPAPRTGTLRLSWRPVVNGVTPSIESDVRYAVYLEHGTSKMARRPFEEKIAEAALPKITRIYSKPYRIKL